MGQAFCTSYETPVTPMEAYDNLTLLLLHIQSLFYVLSEVEQDRAVGIVADLGEELCQELQRRAEILWELCQSTKGGSKHHPGSLRAAQ